MKQEMGFPKCWNVELLSESPVLSTFDCFLSSISRAPCMERAFPQADAGLRVRRTPC